MDRARNEADRRSFHQIWRWGAVWAGALVMMWPALYNKFPLLYPDSMSYLEDGPLVARALFLHKFSADYGGRSFIYCLGILPLHWNVTSWPIIGFNALLTSYFIWLVMRSILRPQPAKDFLLLIVLLSLLTSLPWFVSLIMPDILGPVAYLGIYLLVFARETLSRIERLIVIVFSWWAIASHATHLMLATGICFLLALLFVLRRPVMHCRLRAVGEVAVIVSLAAVAHLALHDYLYGKPSLNGKRLPFLMARVIADGPGYWYLKHNCGQVKLTVCDYLDLLPMDTDDFLWAPDGIWQRASEQTKARLRQEETAFVLATLRAYPREQLSRSASNFWHQLMTFDLSLFHPNEWVLHEFETVLPAERSNYLQSRQARDALPYELFTSIQDFTVIVSLLLIAVFTPRMWSHRSPRLAGLGLVIVSTVVANAFVTGILSMVENRFQSRVIWLLPLLAGILVLDWYDRLEKKRSRSFTFAAPLEWRNSTNRSRPESPQAQ
ncbi:MAG TPA: hypothetical protein VMW15_15975 [Terracidiphilus sp.]|nr:hypothetical protein [Terracidiphilus sp.]